MDVRRKRRLAADINVVPYIDVMLVLVVIFMATATIALGVQVDLPEAAANTLENVEEPIQLTVKSDGALLLNIGSNPDAPVSEDQARDIVSIALRHKPTRRVVVSGDKNADYGSIMNAMVLLQEAGAQKVGLQSRAPERR